MVNEFITAAQNYVIPRRDPLVLDLDGDGLELISANGTVLFDHNADGIKTGTGWAAPNDGLLVRDLNGNGLIDCGRELFSIGTFYADNPLIDTATRDGLRGQRDNRVDESTQLSPFRDKRCGWQRLHRCRRRFLANLQSQGF